MPKLKSKSSAKKRFTLTGSGKIRFNRAKRRHMMMNKSEKVKRHSKASGILCAADAKIVRQFLA